MIKRKRVLFIAAALTLCIGLTACGNIPSELEGADSGVSGGAVSGQAVEADLTDQDEVMAEPVFPVKEQLSVIADNERMWNMGAEEPGADAEPEELLFWIDAFSFRVTDMDQDGYLEILTCVCQGTGHFTDYAVYEVDEAGKSLVKWKIQPDEYVDEKNAAADLGEYPMEVYVDEQTGSYHYESQDHAKSWAAEGDDYLIDLEIKDNTIYEHLITYSHYEPDEKHNTEDDFKMNVRFYDADGKKITEEESNELENDYWKGMKQYDMFFRWEHVESPQCKEMESDERIRLLEDSWEGFSIKNGDRGTEFDEFEKSLPEDVKKQLDVLVNKYNLGKAQDSEKKIYYAVTDLNQNGRLEFVFYTEGQKKSDCTIYEVSESGKKLKKRKGSEIAGSQKEWERLIEESVVCGWKESRGKDMPSMMYSYLYEEFVESWQQFCLQ